MLHSQMFLKRPQYILYRYLIYIKLSSALEVFKANFDRSWSNNPMKAALATSASGSTNFQLTKGVYYSIWLRRPLFVWTQRNFSFKKNALNLEPVNVVLIIPFRTHLQIFLTTIYDKPSSSKYFREGVLYEDSNGPIWGENSSWVAERLTRPCF